MSEIRRLEPDDLPHVAHLLEAAHLRPPSSTQGGYAAFLAGSDHSLVAVEDRAVVGFIGVHPRRLRFDGAVVSAACCSHLVVRPDRRAAGAGPRLLGAFLGQDHDFFYSDTANAVVGRMWRILGGRVEPVRSLEWTIVLHASRWAKQMGERKLLRRGDRGDVRSVESFPFRRQGPRRDAAATITAELDPARLSTLADSSLAPVLLRRDWTAEDGGEALSSVRRWADGAEVVLRSVDLGRRPVGWFAYRFRPGRGARVLQVAAAERHADAVFDAMADDVRTRGASYLSGRVEPHLLDPLQRWRAAIGPSGGRAVVVARDPRLDAVLSTPASQLSQLDGEWWSPV